MGSPFVWYELKAKDTGATRKFYENLLGWEIDEVPGPNGPMTMVGGVTPWAGIAEADGHSAGWIPYVQVADVDKATADARKLGAVVVGDKTTGPAGIYTTIEDPAGARLALWQPA